MKSRRPKSQEGAAVLRPWTIYARPAIKPYTFRKTAKNESPPYIVTGHGTPCLYGGGILQTMRHDESISKNIADR